MKFYGTEVHGLMPALIGMRLPMSKNYEDAKSKVDSIIFSDTCIIGEQDMRVAKNLEKADEKKGGGTPNSKFLQMIEIWVCIEAPLTFWSEFDTYRHMVKNSTSKMHKLHSYPIDESCFEVNPFTNKVSESVDIEKLEKLRQKYNETKDKKDWYELLDDIPSSWLQSRMCHFNYQTLKDMVIWRKEHKLNCWSGKDNPELDNFINWARSLPYAQQLIFIDEVENENN
jgi:hypothetical protein